MTVHFWEKIVAIGTWYEKFGLKAIINEERTKLISAYCVQSELLCFKWNLNTYHGFTGWPLNHKWEREGEKEAFKLQIRRSINVRIVGIW